MGWPGFRLYEDVGMTPRKLAKYLAFFRNAVEIYLARSFSRKLDQRMFDGYVCQAVTNSFKRFLLRLDSRQKEDGKRRVCQACQQYAANLAERFSVVVAWHDGTKVFIPEDDDL